MTDREPKWEFQEEFPTDPPKKKRRKNLTTKTKKRKRGPTPEEFVYKREEKLKRIGKTLFTFYYYECPSCPYKTAGIMNHLGALRTIQGHVREHHYGGRG